MKINKYKFLLVPIALSTIPVVSLNGCSKKDSLDTSNRFFTPEKYELNIDAFSGRHGTIKLNLIDKYKGLIIKTPTIKVKTQKFQDAIFCVPPTIDGTTVTIDIYFAISMEEDDLAEFDLVFSGSTWTQTIEGYKAQYKSKALPNTLYTVDSKNTITGFVPEIKAKPYLLMDYDRIHIPDYVQHLGEKCFKEFAPYCKRVTFGEDSACFRIDPNVFNDFSILESINLPSQLKVIGNNFCSNCPKLNCEINVPAGVETIVEGFLYNCPNFNSPVKLNNVTYITNNFMVNCTSFNQELDISKIHTFGLNFMMGATNFNKKLTMATDSVKFGAGFLYNAYSFTELEFNCQEIIQDGDALSFACDDENADMYAKGITITATPAIKALLQSKYPNSDSFPFRKLI